MILSDICKNSSKKKHANLSKTTFTSKACFTINFLITRYDLIVHFIWFVAFHISLNHSPRFLSQFSTYLYGNCVGQFTMLPQMW